MTALEPPEGQILMTVDIINGVRNLNRTLMRYQLPVEVTRGIEKWCVEQERRIANAQLESSTARRGRISDAPVKKG
jgi:hypothetical protein